MHISINKFIRSCQSTTFLFVGDDIMTYEIMHNETPIAQIDTQGSCHIFSKKFMPFNLYLEEIDSTERSF